MQNILPLPVLQRKRARARVEQLFGERLCAPAEKRMQRWGHRRYTSTRHCSGGVLAVGALIESASGFNVYGLGVSIRNGVGVSPAMSERIAEGLKVVLSCEGLEELIVY